MILVSWTEFTKLVTLHCASLDCNRASSPMISSSSSYLQGKMVLQLSKEPSARLLKHVVRCYLRLSDNIR